MRKMLALALAIALPVAVPVVLTTGMQSALAHKPAAHHIAKKKAPAKAGYNLADGKKVYETDCATCHGTLASRKPTLPNAADFFKGQMRLTHGNIALMEKIVKEGGVKFGHGASAQMPPWGSTLSAKQIADVSAFERGLKHK